MVDYPTFMTIAGKIVADILYTNLNMVAIINVGAKVIRIERHIILQLTFLSKTWWKNRSNTLQWLDLFIALQRFCIASRPFG